VAKEGERRKGEKKPLFRLHLLGREGTKKKKGRLRIFNSTSGRRGKKEKRKLCFHFQKGITDGKKKRGEGGTECDGLIQFVVSKKRKGGGKPSGLHLL